MKMKSAFNWWLLLWVMVFVAACSDGGEEIDKPDTPPTPEQPTITLDTSSSDFTTNGGSNTVSFTASADWTAEVINSRADAWCSVSPTNGKAGNAQITITTTANDTPDNRSASVILKAGTTQKTITVSQKQKDALTVTSDKFEVSAEGGEIKIEVKANIDFEYSIAYEGSAKDWITSEGARALKTSTLTFKVAANEEVEKREATVTIKSGSFKEEVKVYQAGTTPSITLTKNEFVVASAGESIAVEVKSNVDVTVELPTDVDWISENLSRAMSTNTYHFTIAESQEYDQRTAEIKFTNKANNLSETVKVVQVQKDAIVVAKNSYTVDNNGGEIIIEVGHNIDFEIEIADEWIAQKKENSRTFVTDKLIFSITPNEGYDNRESSIRFVSKDKSIVQTVKVYQAQKNAIIISKKNIIVDENGGDVEFEVKSNIDYTVSEPNVDWLHIVKSRALTSQTLRYTVDANTTHDSRETSIIITSDNLADTINIAQAQKDAIVLAKNEYEFEAEGGELDFEILTNVDVTVSIPDSISSWVKQVKSRALVSQTLHFDISPCDLSESRSGTITLSGGDAVQKILIKQDGLKEILEAERNALIAIYNALDGDNWTNNTNWCSDKPVSEWEGVYTDYLGRIIYLNLNVGESKGEFPSVISHLSALEKLNIFSNIHETLNGKWEAVNKTTLPKDIFKLETLKSLSVTGFTIGKDCIQSNISKLKNLTFLNLSYNNLTTDIFDIIIQLTNLKTLSIQNNALSGHIPSSIVNLSNLEDLRLSTNNITGNIPNEICKLSKLTSLVLSNNQLSGEIPTNIGDLLNLTYLDLKVNKLSGSIPASLAKLSKLECLYLNSNLLSGIIPIEVVEMPNWDYHCWYCIYQNAFADNGLHAIKTPKFSVVCTDNTVFDSEVEFKKNKYTILHQSSLLINNVFLDGIKDIYDKYKKSGVDVLTWISYDTADEESNTIKPQFLSYIKDNSIEWKCYFPTKTNNFFAPRNLVWARNYPILFVSPDAVVVDNTGKVVFYTIGEIEPLKRFFEGIMDDGQSEYYTSTDYSQDGKVTTLQTATKGNGIDIVLMGDGYSDRQIADGTYDNTMNIAMEKFFSEEPYKTYRDHFNVYCVKAVSATEGYEHGNTAFSGFFGDGTLVGGNDSQAFNYALKAISYERMDEALIVIMMNSTRYAGTCYMYYPSVTGSYGNGVSVSYFPVGEDENALAQVLHHEAGGHGFAKLADEYAYEDMGAIPATEVTTTKEQQTNWGWWKNVDFTSDPSATRWSHFINDTRYANDGLGAYEGGLTYWRGVWRPTENSIMRYNTGGFNAPSREAIYYRIHKLAYGDSWQYDYEEFVKYDAINRKAAASSYNPYRQTNYKPLHAPVVIRKSWKDAK